MTEREKVWMTARCGKVTGSGLAKLMTKGKSKAEWGEVSLKYLYEKKYELRTGKPIRQESNSNFRFGNDNEGMSIEWLRANTMHSILHCSSEIDFPDSIYFKCDIIENLGDSPDALIDDDAIGETKCLVSQAKFESMRGMSKEDVFVEYKWQLANHLLAHPNRSKVIYWVYDPQSDDDEMDLLDPLDSSRGLIWVYDREYFGSMFSEIEARVKTGMGAVIESLKTGKSIEKILGL